MHNWKSAHGISPEQWVNTKFVSIQAPYFYKFHLREIPVSCPKNHRVFQSGHGGGDVGKRLEEDQGIGHIQASDLDVTNTKPLTCKSMVKVLDKEENFCFRPRSYTLWGMLKPMLLEAASEEIELIP